MRPFSARWSRTGRSDLCGIPLDVRLAVWPFAQPYATIPGVTSVLIVDDHPSFRASARALLQAEGFEVVGEAADGAEALRAAEELHPDVVLLDVQLPDTDGFDVATSASATPPAASAAGQ